MKTCRACGVEKSTTEFYPKSPRCKRCDSERNRKKWAADPARNNGRRRDNRLMAVFGIDSAEYDRLWTEQDGLCAVCGKPESVPYTRGGNPRRLAVDHDHQTGVVRALLCSKCNRGIGLLNDDPQLLRSAAAYIERHSHADVSHLNDAGCADGCGASAGDPAHL